MNSEIKKAIWGELNNIKHKSHCLGLQITKFQFYDRNINVFLAVASSTSIAAWTIWSEFPKVWGAIIAVSQLIMAIKPYFQFNKHVKELNPKCLEIEVLFNKAERLWNDVQLNRITENEASDQLNEIKSERTKILHFSEEATWKISKAVEDEATEKTKHFISNNYNSTFK